MDYNMWLKIIGHTTLDPEIQEKLYQFGVKALVGMAIKDQEFLKAQYEHYKDRNIH